jgi:hypothetical protein
MAVDFTIACRNADETAERIKIIGKAVKFVDWPKNRIIVVVSSPEPANPDSFGRIDQTIKRVKELGNANVWER